MREDTPQRRWDNDEVGHAVVDGGAFAPGVQRLLDALHLPDRVAEEPDLRLLPHLRRVCESSASPWKLVDTAIAEAVYDVTLEWLRLDGNIAALRADIFNIGRPDCGRRNVCASAGHA